MFRFASFEEIWTCIYFYLWDLLVGVVTFNDFKFLIVCNHVFAQGCFAGLGFFSMYLNKMLSIKLEHKNNVGKLLIIVAPVLVAISIAISRVDDYMHHWQDVSIGAIIGNMTCFLLRSCCTFFILYLHSLIFYYFRLSNRNILIQQALSTIVHPTFR